MLEYSKHCKAALLRTATVKDTERLTVPVGQQLHQAVQTRVPHLADVGGAAADGLDGGGDKVFVHAFDVGLQGERQNVN